MTTSPVEFLKETIPALFNDVFNQTRAEAQSGNADAKQKAEELQKAAPMAVRVVLEGKSNKDLYVVFDKGTLRTESSPGTAPVLFAVGVAVIRSRQRAEVWHAVEDRTDG